MAAIIVATAAIIILSTYFYWLIKREAKEVIKMNDKIAEIEELISNVKNGEDCEAILKQVSEYYKNTDMTLKGIRSKLQAKYNFIEGMKYILTK